MCSVFNAIETVACLFDSLPSHMCLRAVHTCCCIWVPTHGEVLSPLAVGLPFSSVFYWPLLLWGLSCILLLSLLHILAVFSVHIFQIKVGDEGLKLCARLRYGKRKVSAKYCQIGFLQRWAGYFSLGSAPGQLILPGNADQWESSLKPSAIQSWLKLDLLNTK